MTIRNRFLIRTFARLGTGCAWMWMRTLRYHYLPLGPYLDLKSPDLPRHLFAFWHETMLLPAFKYRAPGSQVLISQSRDGDWIAEVCRCLGLEPVRGSMSRGGAEAAREIVRVGQSKHLAVTPDGPRGPRRKVKASVVKLAARAGLPIVPSGFAFDRPWRLKSWDRFCVPRPFSRACCVTLDPIVVPADADAAALETYRASLEQDLNYATEVAEEVAALGKLAQAA